MAQAEAAQGGVEDGAAAVATPVALDPYRDFPARFGEIPGVAAADQAVVAGQLGQAVGRAVAFQVAGGGAQVHAAGGQAGGDQAGVLQAAEADGQVELAVQQVHGLVGQVHLDAQLQVLLHEVVDQRHDEFLAVGDRAGHAQQPLGLAGQIGDRLDGFVPGILQVLAVLQEGLAGFGQGDPAGAAVEQSGLQAVFQPGDLAADVGGGDAELPGRTAEVAEFGDADEFVQSAPSAHADYPCVAIMFCLAGYYPLSAGLLHCMGCVH